MHALRLTHFQTKAALRCENRPRRWQGLQLFRSLKASSSSTADKVAVECKHFGSHSPKRRLHYVMTIALVDGKACILQHVLLVNSCSFAGWRVLNKNTFASGRSFASNSHLFADSKSVEPKLVSRHECQTLAFGTRMHIQFKRMAMHNVYCKEEQITVASRRKCTSSYVPRRATRRM